MFKKLTPLPPPPTPQKTLKTKQSKITSCKKRQDLILNVIPAKGSPIYAKINLLIQSNSAVTTL